MSDYIIAPSEGAASAVFKAEVSELDAVEEFLEKEVGNAGVSMKISMQLSVALEELFVNVASYAYPEGGGKVQLDISAENGIIEFVLADKGIPFDPTASPDPDVTLGVEERGIGGLGILMVKKTMDDMKYERRDGVNILKVNKKYA